jgi:hypothetical protein
MTYRDYELFVHPTWTEFGARICFIKQRGLTITKAVGATEEAAIEAAERWVDARLKTNRRVAQKYGATRAVALGAST